MSYCTKALVKEYRGISGAGEDSLIDALIDRVEALIDRYTHRHFEAETETRYFLREALLTAHTLLVDKDLLTITGVVNGDSDETAIPTTEFFLYPRNYTPYYGLTLKTNSTYSWEWDTDCYVAVTGTWGFSATAPNDIVQVAIRWTAFLYAQKDAQVFTVTAQPDLGIITVPEGIPADVKLMLAPYIRTMGS